MTTKKKILLGIGLVGVAIGGYALVKFLTRNVWVGKYGNKITHVEFDTPPTAGEIED